MCALGYQAVYPIEEAVCLEKGILLCHVSRHVKSIVYEVVNQFVSGP